MQSLRNVKKINGYWIYCLKEKCGGVLVFVCMLDIGLTVLCAPMCSVQEKKLRLFQGDRSRLGEPDLFMVLLMEVPR